MAREVVVAKAEEVITRREVWKTEIKKVLRGKVVKVRKER